MAVEIQQFSTSDARWKWIVAWGINLRQTAGDWPWAASGPFMIVLTMRSKTLYIVKADLASSIYSKAFHHAMALAVVEQARAQQLGCKCSMPPSVVHQYNPG